MGKARVALAFALSSAIACGLELGGSGSGPNVVEPAPDAATQDRIAPPLDVAVIEDASSDMMPDVEGCDGTTCYPSCKALKEANPSATDGLYTFKASRTYEAYCDMTTANGGWTLVARSVTLSNVTSFGWDKETGSPAVDTAAYSLRVPHVGLTFREILVGTYSLGKVFALSAYRVDVPADFLTYRNKSAAVTVTAIKTAAGCAGTPSMLGYWGFLDEDDHYFIGNASGRGAVGLYADGFKLQADDCNTSGLMDGDQGMIFVR
jgi:hypothetical protein